MTKTATATEAPVGADQVYAWLDGHGVAHSKARRVPVGAINEQASRRNQARAESLDKDVVDRYATAVRAGETFPPVVGFLKGGKFQLIDGNHRDSAHRKAGADEIWLIEVDGETPSELIYLLTAEANTRHGAPTTTEWRAHQAVHLAALGFSQDTIAESLGVSKSVINGAIKADEAARRAVGLGLRRFSELRSSQQTRLSTITNDHVFKAVYDLAIATDWSAGADFNKFVSDVNRAKSEAEALRLVATRREEREEEIRAREAVGKPKKSLPSYRTRVVTAIGAVQSLDPEMVSSVFMTDSERTEMADRFAAASLKLMELEEAVRD